MGLFDFLKKKEKKKEKEKPKEAYIIHGELINEIIERAKEYSVNECFQEKYNQLGVDITYLNSARFELEMAVIKIGKSIEEFYDYQFTKSFDTKEENKNFYYSIMAMLTIATNCTKCYTKISHEARLILDEAYEKSSENLFKVKEILNDGEAVERAIKAQEDLKIELENKVSMEYESLDIEKGLKKINENINEFVDDIKEIISEMKNKRFNYAVEVLKKMENRKDDIIFVCNTINNKFNDDKLINMCIDSINSCTNDIKFRIKLLESDIKMIKLDYEYGQAVELENFKSNIEAIQNSCKMILDEIIEISGRMIKEEYKNETVNSEDNSEACFYINYYTRYYFYDKDEFIEEIDNGELIYNNICEYDRYNDGEFEYRFTKNDKISVKKTLENVSICFEENLASVKINNERVYLDLKYKFEVDELDNEVKISTKINEMTESISCMIYINKDSSERFIQELNKVKEVQLRNKSLRNNIE